MSSQVDLDGWERLTSSSKEAFRWAKARSEGGRGAGEAASDDLLYGILRAHWGASEVEQLLRRFVPDPSILEYLLKDLGGSVGGSWLDSTEVSQVRHQAFNPSELLPLGGLPLLTSLAASVLDTSLKLASNLNPERDKLVRLRDLFGGILLTPDCGAFQHLAGLLGDWVPIEELQKSYPDFLQWDSRREYREFLEERFPQGSAAQQAAQQPERPPGGDREEVEEQPANLVRPRAVSDMPSLVDTLGFKPLVEGVATLLNDQRTSLPLAIALTAPWGAGKSSVMLQIESRLKDSQGIGLAPQGRSWYTISFPAWRYEKSERLWAALAKAVYDQVQEQMKGSRSRLWFRVRLQWRRSGGPGFLLTRLALPGVAAGIAAGVAATSVTGFDGTQVAATGGGSFAALLATVWSRFWGLFGDPFKRSLQAYVSRPKYEEQLGFTAEAERDVRHLMDTATGQKEDRVLAIFVDDLDRCSSRHIVEMVEAINQIFSSAANRRCVFILGMDREVVAANIDVAYKDTIAYLREQKSPLAKDFGYQFLSKIVQMSVDLPSPQPKALEELLRVVTGSPARGGAKPASPSPLAVRTYTELLLRRAHSPTDVDRIVGELKDGDELFGGVPPTDEELGQILEVAKAEALAVLLSQDDSEDVRQAELAALKFLDKNPRQVKRFDNAFRLQLHIAYRTPGNALRFDRGQLTALAKWVALRLRWPKLAEALDREPELLKALEQQGNGEGEPSDDLKQRYDGWFSEPEILELLGKEKGEGDQEHPGVRISSLPFDSFLRVA